jgi:uncharacterized RDD family membrane protein YckC
MMVSTAILVPPRPLAILQGPWVDGLHTRLVGSAVGAAVPVWLTPAAGRGIAIGELFGVHAPAPPSADGGASFQPPPGPFILVELAYFTWIHATSAGQSVGNRILGIRVLDAGTGRALPYARAFVRALVSFLSALAFFLGFLWMLWEPRKRTWQDIVADSLVVRTAYHPPAEFARPVRESASHREIEKLAIDW